jgi:hypothetical protein
MDSRPSPVKELSFDGELPFVVQASACFRKLTSPALPSMPKIDSLHSAVITVKPKHGTSTSSATGIHPLSMVSQQAVHTMQFTSSKAPQMAKVMFTMIKVI